MNDVEAPFNYKYNEASHIWIDNNTITGGNGCRLYGNFGGSLSGNSFSDQRTNSASLFAWKNCTVNNNSFVNLGIDQDTVGINLLSYNGVGATGNAISGNLCADNREAKYTAAAVVLSQGPHDRNIVTRNNATGAKPGAKAVINLSSSANNIVAENIDD